MTAMLQEQTARRVAVERQRGVDGPRHPVLPMRCDCIVGLPLADRAISTAVVMRCVPWVTVMVRTLR